MLYIVAYQSTTARPVSFVIINRIDIAGSRHDCYGIEIDKVSMAAGYSCCIRQDPVRVMADRAGRLLVHYVRLMSLKALVGEDAISVVASVA